MRVLLSDVCIFIALFSPFFAFAVPPDRGPKPEQVIPNIAGPSAWGWVSQPEKGKIKIEGHPRWSAVGEFQRDGTILLLWTQLDDGKIAPGIYRIEKDGAIRGRWNYGTEVERLPNGEWKGLEFHDLLRAAPKFDL